MENECEVKGAEVPNKKIKNWNVRILESWDLSQDLKIQYSNISLFDILLGISVP